MAPRGKKEIAAEGAAALKRELEERKRELADALESQAAVSDILRLIATSPGNIKPVFDAVAERAAHICEAQFADVVLVENGMISNSLGRFGELGRWAPDEVPADRTTVTGRSICDRSPVHVGDALEAAEFPRARQLAQRFGHRTILSVPLLHDQGALGAIVIRRTEVRPFEDKHIALLKTFADQAAIAIENARLFNELRQRTDDLSESLEQQTATSEVLKVIGRSTFDLQPVFDIMAENAVKLCEAERGFIFRFDGEVLRAVASYNVGPEIREFIFQSPIAPGRQTISARAALERQTVQVTDIQADDEHSYAVRDEAPIRTVLAVPMLRGDELVGTITIYRLEVEPFTDKQISLVETFAAQAVIAIENARLLNELRQRTDDLSESLEQQTATSEVLKVISDSPGELQPVFDAMLENATRICGAKFSTMHLREGDLFRTVATHNAPPAYVEARARNPMLAPSPDGPLSRMLATNDVAYVEDFKTTRGYTEREPGVVQAVELGGYRSVLAVPMLKEGAVIGAITIFLLDVAPFTDKQIELVRNFAAQAVIAIENARLLNEVRTLNQQLEGRVSEQVGEIERMGRLRRFLSPQVADLIVSSGGEKQLESHRREISALFCDLRGFTGFSETSDPEDVMALLREYHKAIGEIIFRHGGTLERFAGDGVMVIFGDPVPLENPALAAVMMSLEMRVAIGGLIERWRRLGHELGFGIGIAHGYATLGTIGFEGRFDYAAIGTVSNVASRLCDEAQPGQILISPRVLLAVEDAVAVEPVSEMSLKGIRRPIQVHNVLAAK